MATSIEDSARINHHARRMNLARDYAFGLNFHAPLRKNNSIKSAGDDHMIPFDLPFDLSAFTEDYGLLGNDIAFDVAIDTESALDL